jgi:hypothetical protein
MSGRTGWPSGHRAIEHLTHAGLEAATEHTRQPQPEAAQQASDAVLDIAQAPGENGAGGEQCPLLPRRAGLHVHGAKPPEAQEVRHAAGVVAIGLGDHRRERGTHLPGLH